MMHSTLKMKITRGIFNNTQNFYIVSKAAQALLFSFRVLTASSGVIYRSELQVNAIKL